MTTRSVTVHVPGDRADETWTATVFAPHAANTWTLGAAYCEPDGWRAYTEARIEMSPAELGRILAAAVEALAAGEGKEVRI